MKKLLVLLLAMLMVVCFAACGETNVEDNPEQQQEQTQEQAQDPQEDAQEPEESQDQEAALPEVKAPEQEITFANEFSFKVNDIEVTSEDLKDCQIYKVKLDTLLDKDGNPATDKETGEPLVVSYTGYKLVDVLEAVGVSGATAIAVATDGFESDEYDLSYLPDYLILAVEKDKQQAADGTLYFAPCFEQTNGKYVKAVDQIIVK